jgi:hypothetical protein
MSSLSRRLSPVLAAAAMTLCVSPALPAHAASATRSDRAGDIAQPWDLRQVKINNAARNVWVKMSFRDLAPDTTAGFALFLDTDGDARPDLRMTGGMYDGTDYQLAAVDSWKLRSQGEPVDCSYGMRLDYTANVARVRISRGCLGAAQSTGAVGVEVRASGSAAQGKAVVDWLGKARAFTAPVPQG